ncbi:MAG: HEAT repeat domain-containing protein, partial [Blastocatellia bacterium]
MIKRIPPSVVLSISLACFAQAQSPGGHKSVQSGASQTETNQKPANQSAGNQSPTGEQSGGTGVSLQQEAALKARLALVIALRPDSPDDDFRKALSSDDWYVRGEAALAAARLKKKLPLDAIIPLLEDKMWFVRSSALDALEVCGDTASGAAVEKLLEPSDPFLCARAAALLGELKYEQGAESLIRLLSEENPVIKSAAAVALGRLKTARATESLVGLLKDSSPEVRSAAAEALGEIGDQHTGPAVETAMKDAGDDSWIYAIALYRLGNHTHLDGVIASLKSPYADERFAALAAVTEFKDPDSVPVLVNLSKADPPAVATPTESEQTDVAFRAGLTKALGQFDDSQTGAALVSMLQDPQPEVRASAVEAISARVAAAKGAGTVDKGTGKANGADKAADQTLVSAIIGLLKDEQSPLVLAAVDKSMKSFDRDQMIDALLGSLKSGANVRQTLTDMGVTTEAEAVQLANGTTEEKMRAVDVLGRLGDPHAVEPLMKTLASSKEPALKARVALTLGGFKDRNTEDALLDASRDSQAEVRAAAVSALGRLGDSSVAGTLFDATRDSSGDVRDAAFRSLGLMGISVERLSADITNPNWQARITAVATLARLHDPRAVPVVMSALKDSDERVRAESARALAVLADNQAVEPLIGALSDSSPEVRFQAAAALGIFKDHRSVTPLEAALM